MGASRERSSAPTFLDGSQANAPSIVVDEYCDSVCVCPQSLANWWEKEFLVVSNEMREAFGEDFEEEVATVSVCETPTSRLWSQNEQALAPGDNFVIHSSVKR